MQLNFLCKESIDTSREELDGETVDWQFMLCTLESGIDVGQ